jgi:hypothetical protein
VPIRDIEQLANVEARLGERRAEAEMAAADGTAGSPGASASAEALIDMALDRLAGLDALLQSGVATSGAALTATASAPHNERSALRGSAWKRKASLRARSLISGRLNDEQKSVAIAEMKEYLSYSIKAYRSAEGSPGSSGFKVYNALNRLALDALTAWDPETEREAAIKLARLCRHTAAQDFEADPEYWNAVNQPEALLVERLLDEGLGQDGEAGQADFEELANAYDDALSNVTVRPSELDSTIAQMNLLSRFYKALSMELSGDEALQRTSARLIELARELVSGRPTRTDRARRTKAAAATRSTRPRQ